MNNDLRDELIAKALARMFRMHGSKDADRQAEYADALVEDGSLCVRCTVDAIKGFAENAKRLPSYAEVRADARSRLKDEEHDRHLAEAKALPGATNLQRWWKTEAPAIVGRLWPELPTALRLKIASRLQGQECHPSADGISVALGYVDRLGPSTERMWWYQTSDLREELIAAMPSGADPRLPVGDR